MSFYTAIITDKLSFQRETGTFCSSQRLTIRNKIRKTTTDKNHSSIDLIGLKPFDLKPIYTYQGRQ